MPDPALQVEGDFLIGGGAAAAEQLLDAAGPTDGDLRVQRQHGRSGHCRSARAHGACGSRRSFRSWVSTTPSRQRSTYPPLTTVRQPLKELGSMAVELLFRLLAEQWSEPLHVELATRLVVRASSAAPKLT